MEFDKREPSKEPDNAYNIAVTFQRVIWWGFRIHLSGFIINSLFGVQIYKREEAKPNNSILLCIVGTYTFVWVMWVVSLIVVRFKEFGRICSGDYLPEGEKGVKAGYAV